ncbi:HD domain-containing protein [Halocynthiibacter namhaensis]|uniref:HD domain-containing protein n=1 Tax=Halocynthiibacter namhaensis TaxID=1290553 RepID=UPI0005791F3B|nr:HD domain-containing protein [Halocynthiibacter namhaensis]
MVASDQIGQAFAMAFSHHAGQMDKLGEPYVAHLVRVASGVETAAQQIVALLHDIVEDSNCTLDALRAIFDETIVDAVDAMTKRPAEDYDIYLCRVHSNAIAQAVKLADIADNTSPRRVAGLDPETQVRLTAKYKHAVRFLNEKETGLC